jgi:hypothetical protein
MNNNKNMGTEFRHIIVDSIVAVRDGQPYVRITIDGVQRAQLTVSEARAIGQDLLVTAGRSEADAMILKFFSDHDLPREAATEMLKRFREFRLHLDQERVEQTFVDPDNPDHVIPREVNDGR